MSHAGPRTIADDMQCWRQHLAVLRRSPRTVSTYGTALKKLRCFLSQQGVTRSIAISPRHLADWRDQLVADGCQPASVDLFLRAARAWLRWLTCTGSLFADPSIGLATPRIPRTLGRYPSEAQMRRLLESINGHTPLALRDRALLETAYATAARRSELAALDLGSVDLPHGIVRLHGKGQRERMVPLTPSAAVALTRYLKHSRPALSQESGDPALFLSSRGGRRLGSAAIAVAVRRWSAVAGFELTPHAIRRAVATHLVRRGAPIFQVKELLGHQSFRHLARYSLPQLANVRELLRHSRLNR